MALVLLITRYALSVWIDIRKLILAQHSYVPWEALLRRWLRELLLRSQTVRTKFL